MFLKSISNFRGLAIIAIVAVHIYPFGFNGDDLVTSFVKNILAGGTFLFVFISGFMFHYVFYEKFKFSCFYINKFKNVISPYLFLISLAILMLIITRGGYFKPIEYNDKIVEMYKDGMLFSLNDHYFVTTFKYYITGRALTAYWYIPFAALLFACSPIHMKFANLCVRRQLLIVVSLSIVSIFSHRSVGGVNAVHSLVYFTPIYLIGIMTSIHRDYVANFSQKNMVLLFVLVLATAGFQVAKGDVGSYHKAFFEYGGIDFQYVQKIFLIFLLYGFFEKYTFDNYIVNVISETSFSIYFIHPWLILIARKMNQKLELFPMDGHYNNLVLYMLTLVFMVASSVGIALTAKSIFRGSKKTRYVLGY